MTQRLYGTYRPERITSPYSPDGQVTMNGTYTCGFFLSSQFWDWAQAGLTKILDMEIPEEKYTGEVVPWVKKLTRFVMCEYNELYVDPAELSRSLTNVGARFDITVFATPTEATAWLKANTNLVERTPWVFVISEATVGMMGENIPEKLLTIA